jgi:hypothetical protein
MAMRGRGGELLTCLKLFCLVLEIWLEVRKGIGLAMPCLVFPSRVCQETLNESGAILLDMPQETLNESGAISLDMPLESY